RDQSCSSMTFVLSPAGLAHPRDFSPECQFPKTDTTHAELAEERPPATTPLAAVIFAHRVFGRLLRLLDPALLGHPGALSIPSLFRIADCGLRIATVQIRNPQSAIKPPPAVHPGTASPSLGAKPSRRHPGRRS